MFKIDSELLKEYAKLAVELGVNVQPGQPLEIRTSVEAYELARECAKVAYEKGASKVIVEYDDEPRTRMNYEYMSEENLAKVPNWQLDKIQENIDSGYCRLFISGSNPDLLNGIDPKKIQNVSIARMNATKKFQYYSMNNVGQWSIVAYPEINWAHKVFPDIEDDDEAMNALWDAILMTSRVELGKTVDNWNKHNAEIKEHSKKLNDYNFKSLHFKNSLGTDLTVGLIKDHIWEGGSDIAHGKYKCEFNPNIPTEEVFTSPDCKSAEGVVYSSKPLYYNGGVIDNFSVEFKDGKAIKCHAKKGEKLLKSIIDFDENSCYLGECALVEVTSPINKTGVIFKATLLDENASCHLAFGQGFGTGSKKSLEKRGINFSKTHVDFMIGDDTLNITGIKNGEKIPIMKSGRFVI